MNKQESKYQNTALLMDEALLLLLEKKDYEYINVKEICQKAGVSRSAFYLHYETIDDLLQETISMLNKKFTESYSREFTAEKAMFEDKVLTTSKYLVPYLEFIRSNKRAFKIQIDKPNVFMGDKTFERLYEKLFSPILDAYKLKGKEKRYIFEFYFKGVLAIIYAWIEDDCLDPIDEIVDLIERCTLQKKEDERK